MKALLLLWLTVLPLLAQDIDCPVFLAETAATGATTYYGVTNQPIVWLKADAQSFNDGDAVTTVTDSSGRGNHAGQATAGKKPTYKTGSLGGLATFRFDGGDCLTNPTVDLTTYTIFLVTSNSSHGILVEHGANAGSVNGSYFYTDAPFASLTKRDANEGGHLGSAGWGLGNSIIADATNPGTLAGYTVLTNGVAIGGTTGGVDPTSASVSAQLNIGSRNNAGSLPLTGHISEVIVFSPNLSSGDANTVRAAINAKYVLY